jgi:glucose/arabinose dehydrogenase
MPEQPVTTAVVVYWRVQFSGGYFMKRSSLLIAVLILCVTAVFVGQERRGGRGGRPESTMDSSPKLFDTKDYKIRVVTIAENLVYPYCFTFLPDGRALVVESEGRLRVIRDGKLQRLRGFRMFILSVDRPV